MDRKMWVYAGLILVVAVAMGIGIWQVTSPKNPVTIPESEPIVQMDVSFPEGGTLSQLSIYEDGTVIHIEDSAAVAALKPGDAFTRTWRTGKAKTGDIDYLFSYLESVDFNDIETTYISESLSERVLAETADNVTEISLETDNYIRISADNGPVDNVVAAFGYLQPGTGAISELPYPLNNIYAELAEIIENSTEKVLTEELTK